jgi:anthranilate phosphoribosyltransferase
VRSALARVIDGHALEASEMRAAMEAILEGRAGAAEVAGLAVALRMRGETRTEIGTAAAVLRERMVRPPIDPALPTLDTCGTGGDGSGSFNVSTVAAIVAAACGVKVAKHGNRAVSSRAGSADLLEALGVALDPGPEVVSRQIRELGIAFLLAPAYHGALRHAAPVRRELGVRTFFNLLGPLVSPARCRFQLMGVFEPGRVEHIAEVLGDLGVERAWVVHGRAEDGSGLDEISPAGPTTVARLERGAVRTEVITPETFGVLPVPVRELAGGDAEENARIARGVLDGQLGAPRTAVVLNAAAALMVAGVESDPVAARVRAERAIDGGDARRLLEAWRASA